MQGRKLIEKNVVNAWKLSIANDYCKQRINSERSLQASFWSYLNNLIPDDQRLFIEPKISVGSKRIYPDIVVCRKKLVTAIIELKYLPRAKPKFEKDIKTLAFISRNRKRILVSNKRFTGETTITEYKLSTRILFVYACVHKNINTEDYPSYASRYSSLKGCYLQLHAETNKSNLPRVFCLSG